MPHVRLSAGRARRHTRGGALDRALVAAGEPTLNLNFETTRATPCERFFTYQVIKDDFSEMDYRLWPTLTVGLADMPVEPLFRDGHEAVYRLGGGTLALVDVCGGFCRTRIAGPTVAGIQQALTAFQEIFPMTFVNQDDNRIPISFWMYGSFGPVQRPRMIDTASWAAVEDNYPEAVRDALAPLMDGFKPGKDGQLLLWHGPPGTGKTWALRALASEWRGWAEFSYITDPDAFFVDHPSYMVDVLLADTFSAIEPDSGTFYEETGESKWRVLILEDTGELLSAGAKEKYGQGVSRLLNVVDGMIGQGLRVLCLVTTNEELGELNAAVRRPGRCASQILFPAFPEIEAALWLAGRGVGGAPEGPMSLAEMYAAAGDQADPLPDDDESVVAAAAASYDDDGDDVVNSIRQVAEKHQDSAIGYGETAWDPETATVYWIHGDWTDCDAAQADFLAIDGVENVKCDAEGIPDGWPYSNVVYPERPPKWVTTPPEKAKAALDSLVDFASQPLVFE